MVIDLIQVLVSWAVLQQPLLKAASSAGMA